MSGLSRLKCVKFRRPLESSYISLIGYRCSKRTVKTLQDVPGPKQIPLLGNLHLFGPFGPFKMERFTNALNTIHHQYGPIVRLRLGIDMVFLFEPEDVAKVFRTEGEYPTRPPFEALKKIRLQDSVNYRCAGMFSENGKNWLHLRKLVNPLLRAGALHPYLDKHCEIADDFVVHLKELSDTNAGRITDCLFDLYKYTQEAVSVICFAERLGCFGKKHHLAMDVNELVTKTLDAMGKTLLEPPWWKIFPTPTFRALTSTQKALRRITDDLLNDAQAKLLTEPSENRQNWFLESLLSRKDLDHRDVGLIALELFQAGIDATASVIAMSLYYLGSNLDIQEKLIYEVDTLAPLGTVITPELLSGMKYTRMCIKETLRLAPPAGGSARILDSNLKLSDYEIPAGTLVIASHPVMSRSESLVSNPNSFCPERWERVTSRSSIHPFVSLPFGFGRRLCPGRQIAEQEILIFLIKFFQRFRCLYFGEEVSTIMRLNYIPDKPLRFTFVERKQ